jgi:hypothetical protein
MKPKRLKLRTNLGLVVSKSNRIATSSYSVARTRGLTRGQQSALAEFQWNDKMPDKGDLRGSSW